MRNLLLRVAVAVVGIPLLLYIAHAGAWPLRVLVVAIQGVALFEWHRLWAARQAHLPLPALALATAGVDFLFFSDGEPIVFALAVGFVAVMFLTEVYRRFREPLLDLGGAALFLLYVVLPLALWVVLANAPAAERFAPAGPLIVLFVATWMCDTGAYFTGRALGRHKLYPAASPNKTVEGFVGGLVASALVVPVFAALSWVSPRLPDYVALPLIVGVLGQSGDLLESLMKREVQLKDTSAILPGHGGVLDRFDSLLLATLFFYSYLMLTFN